MHGPPLCALTSKISRKGRKGLAKVAKRDPLWLCGLCVPFAPFAGNNRGQGRQVSVLHHSKIYV